MTYNLALAPFERLFFVNVNYTQHCPLCIRDYPDTWRAAYVSSPLDLPATLRRTIRNPERLSNKVY